MKKIILFSVIGIFIISSFGAGAIKNDVQPNHSINKETELEGIVSQSFTHNVLVEYGTTSTCPNCPPVRGFLNTIYNSGDYDFYYVTLNADKEPLANSRYWELPSAQYVPTVWFDGGYKYIIGNQGSTTPYINYINNCGARSVADIDIDVSVTWLGNAEIEIKVSVYNSESSSYSGHLHAYVTEIESRWNDYSGQKYHFSMIGYAFNKNINIGSGSTWSETVTWDGDTHGYGNIKEDNIMIIASVFNPTTKHVDETDAATTSSGGENDPPNSPDINGPAKGIPGVMYNFSFVANDPDNDDIYLYVKWGDDQIEEWIGPYKSGEEVILSHTWSEKGRYFIKAKAKDNQDEVSSWNTLVINIPRYRNTNINIMKYLIEKCPYLYKILSRILGQ